MSADNWTRCTKCVEIVSNCKDSFVKKYYGILDAITYNKILKEIEKAIEHSNSLSGKTYKPNEEVLKMMYEKDITVNLVDVKGKSEDYSPSVMLFQNNVGCSLREDYEQGVNEDGTVYMSYDCSCDQCGFQKSVSYDEKTQKIVVR